MAERRRKKKKKQLILDFESVWDFGFGIWNFR